jgi:hypothetical protein
MPGWIAEGAALRMMRMRAEEELRMLNLLKAGSGLIKAEDSRQFVRDLMSEAELTQTARRAASVSDLADVGISLTVK